MLVAVLLSASAGATDEARTMHVYHIGNSLIRSLTPDRVHRLFAERGVDYQFSTQLAGGCNLKRHWAARENGMKTRQWETNKPVDGGFEPGGPDWDPNPKRFGPYWQALAEYQWDALVLQPYRSHMRDDLPAIGNFIRLAVDRGTVARVYIYQTWPNRPLLNRGEQDRAKRIYEDIDYQALWNRKYPFDEDTAEPRGDAFQSRDYFAKLVEKANSEYAARLTEPIRMIPVGDVWYECDRRIRAGDIPGLAELWSRDASMVPGWEPADGIADGVNVFYADGIHPNPIPHLTGNVANFVNGLTFFAVLAEQSPVGLSGAIYGLDDELDAPLIGALQETVWDVVRGHPYTAIPVGHD
jgi:hypothetical protein